MTRIGTVIDGKYEILREIGRGGMSIVYLAMDTHLNKQWAVKEIRKKGSTKKDEVVVNSLMAEANLMKKLDHSALPRIVDIIDTGVTIYIVMDYIEGESLDKVLAAEGAQPEDVVLKWAMQLCDVLGYLHGQKKPIIYRDMKPSNVMLKPEGNLKIIDFGIAREYKEQSVKDTTVLGTKGYAPPEQYTGQTDARSDIFALGMTMHHLLTGVEPRPGEPYIPVRQWNPELSEGIEAIINKCVEPAPENRYQNCAELMYDLQDPKRAGKGYRRKQKRQLATFITAAAMSVVMAISGFACSAAATAVNNSTYEAKISIVSSDLEEKIASYKDAIKIYPEDTRAYASMLDAYLEEGQFGSRESSEFLAMYNAYKDRFDEDSVEVAELNYKIGLMYFNYYKYFEVKDDLDQVARGFNERLNMAYPFFAANHGNEGISDDFEEAELNDCYYQICNVYKQYIMEGTTVDEAGAEQYELLLDTIGQMRRDIADAGMYDKITLYNTVFRLINDQIHNMRSVGIEKEVLLDLLESIYRDAEALPPQKDRTRYLQSEIVNNYNRAVAEIERAYEGLRGGDDA